MMGKVMKNKISRNIYFIPYVLWIALFVIAPILLILYYSFFDIEGNLSLINYQKFFTPVYLKMTLSSFWYAFLITGYPFSRLPDSLFVNENQA